MLFISAFVCVMLFQNGGNTLCVVDDSNDHVLSVWDWQREDRLAEVKVCLCACVRVCACMSVRKCLCVLMCVHMCAHVCAVLQYMHVSVFVHVSV